MKHSILPALALSSLIAVFGTVSLMAQNAATYKIPFGFTVGSTSFAPGEYVVKETAQHILRLDKADRKAGMFILTVGDSRRQTDGKSVLFFNRYGERYFLSRISDSGRGESLPISAREKELIAARASPIHRDVLALNRK
jgi:hypothetical protein